MTYTPRAVTPLLERLMAKVDRFGECWRWTGATTPTGYGVISRGRRAGAMPAHRAAYELLVGPIPEGLDLPRGRACRTCKNEANRRYRRKASR